MPNKYLLLTVITLLTCAVSTAQAQEPSRIEISRFHTIDAKGNLHILLLPNDSSSYITVELYGVSSKEFKYNVKQGVLYIDVPSGMLDKVGYVRLIASSQNIKAFYSLGASVECLRPIKGNNFEYQTKGARNSAQLWVEVANLSVTTTGDSDVSVSGTSQSANYVATMNSRINALYLHSDRVSAKANTSAEIYLASNGTLKAKASTCGSIYYIGTPTIEPKMSLWGGITAIEKSDFAPQFEGLWNENRHTMFETDPTTTEPTEPDETLEEVSEDNSEQTTATESVDESVKRQDSEEKEEKKKETKKGTTEQGDFF